MRGACIRILEHAMECSRMQSHSRACYGMHSSRPDVVHYETITTKYVLIKKSHSMACSSIPLHARAFYGMLETIRMHWSFIPVPILVNIHMWICIYKGATNISWWSSMRMNWYQGTTSSEYHILSYESEYKSNPSNWWTAQSAFRIHARKTGGNRQTHVSCCNLSHVQCPVTLFMCTLSVVRYKYLYQYS